MRNRATTHAFVAALLIACSRHGGSNGEVVDTALLHRAGGDVMLEGGGRLDYEITSDRYRRWEAARRALRAARISLTMRLDPLHVSEADIQHAVGFFENNSRAKRAIEATGLSVRDYVLTTIALEQQMAVANGRWGERERPASPPTPIAPAESIAAELARDTARHRVDTVPVIDTVVVPVDSTRPDTTATGGVR